ncbi:ATP-dependent DNA helicase PIF1-like, partial [Musca vetustissima]|uniref:ATP-dependent DNA helicase PIF1-like n=1 Tax=Musca vetustissima TaxID=27455 RepID=UPI002AB78D99
MAHKKSLEALDRTLQDLRDNQQPFGGALILLAGDFRQTLPVLSRSTPADELNACLKSSHLWRYVKKLSLTLNMRIQLQNHASARLFARQLLDIGNGKIATDNVTGLITLPADCCVLTESKEALISNVYPDIERNFTNHQWLSDRAILAAKNKDVSDINVDIQNKISGEIKTYKSIDCVNDPDEIVNYPIEFLNSLDLPGTPPHMLQLKVGVPIILLRNLNPPRLLRLAFAMTINKSQGQSLK